MNHIQTKALSHFRRPPVRSRDRVQTEGPVIRSSDTATRLGRLITQTLGDYRLRPQNIGAVPVRLSEEDIEQFSEGVCAALTFARNAS